MELFSFNVENRRCAVVIDLDLQLERLLLDGSVVSVKPLGELTSHHNFDDPQLGQGTLIFTLDPERQLVDYELRLAGAEPLVAAAALSEEARAIVGATPVDTQAASAPQTNAPQKSWLILGGIALKLLKTLKVAKVALAAASVAVYSVMFTFEFALALIAVLVVHEYGHIRAMQKFGIPTKGIYLIPFFGGIALGDKARTQWEELYISMMGPVYGLAMTAMFYIIFLATDSHFCGLVASTSALLNLANLFPVYPLDGGRVVKALVFSRRNYLALMVLLVLSALCLAIAWHFKLVFLCFFILIGVVDLIAAWNLPLSADMTPLKTYGIWFSLAWYLLVALAFILMIVLIAKADVPGAEIAIKILQS